MARKIKLEIVPTANGSGEHFLRLRGGNGETVVVTEPLASKGNARRAAKRLPALLAKAEVVEVEVEA